MFSDFWEALAALTWVGFLLFSVLVDFIQFFHKLVSSITAFLFSLAMLLNNPFSFKNILEARFELKFLGTYRLGNRFSKIGQADYLLLIPDLLKGFCDEASIWNARPRLNMRYCLPARRICTLMRLVYSTSGLPN